MFQILFFTALWCITATYHCCAQGRLYYFITKDGSVGVKNGAGKIIIPADYSAFTEQNGDTVDGQIIFLVSRDTVLSVPGLATPYRAFDRNGKYLFTPFLFDNGPDYISEGLFRFVQDGKIGFADREGRIVIGPKFGFATPFQHGLSFYCTGCSFYRDTISADVEHNLRLTASRWGIVGKDGTILTPSTVVRKEKIDDGLLADFVPPGFTDDVLEVTDSLLSLLPPQFTYTPEEQKILQKLTSSAYLGSMVSANVLTDTGMQVSYEIVERPKATFPFYWVKGFHRINGVYTDAEENFLISINGADIYKYEPGLNDMRLLLPWKTKLRRR